MKKLTLNGTWNMNSLPVTIPGSVLSCLLTEQKIEDPYFGTNEYATRDLFWNDYEFDRTFEVSTQFLEQQNIDLVCYGLDTLCDVILNGVTIATTNNMHRTWRFPVKDKLKEGQNEIKIICKSILKYIESYKNEPHKPITFFNAGTIEGSQYIRKPHSMLGWDWGAQLPDAGISRDIELEAYSDAKIEEILFEQKHQEHQVELTVNVTLWNKSQEPVELTVTLFDCEKKDCIIFEYKENLVINQETWKQKILIDNPKLWWPNGFGKQPLYSIVITISKNKEELQQKQFQLGLRTLEISRDKDQWGEEFCFKVNGIKIFAKGANYIPEDCVYSRITKERMEYLIDSSVRANYNILRIWGGGYYPSDLFYQMCDEKGIIIWQDLMYACNIYEVTDEFAENIVAEAIDNVKRLRHHACLGLWCGNNELEGAWCGWTDFMEHNEYVRADYLKQFEFLLPKAVSSSDHQTSYWPSSPSSGGCFDNPHDENRGDVHFWEVWHGQKPFSEYQKHYFRFCSEFGFQSFPCLKTVETFTKKEDHNIFSEVMESHQKSGVANGKILYYLSQNFKYPKDFDSLLYVSQVLQGIAIKSGVEHWRRNRGRCMGSIYWQINDNWPVASWSSIDYFGRWKALHYMAKNFYEPIAGSLLKVENDDGVTIGAKAFVQNESLEPITVNVTLSLKKLDFSEIICTKQTVKLEPFAVVEACLIDFEHQLLKETGICKNDVFVEASFQYENGLIQYESETLIPYKHMLLPKSLIHIGVKDQGDAFEITLQADHYTAFVELSFKEADAIFSDNFINITSKQPRKILLLKKDIRNGQLENENDVLKNLKLRSIAETF